MLRMPRLHLSLGIVIGLMAWNADATSSKAEDNAEPINIGVVGPQSGPASVIGLDQVRAAQLAAEIANANGGILGRKVKVIARDSQNESTLADTQAFRDLSGNDVHYVVGFASSAVCAALGPIAQQLNILYFGQCSDPSLLADAGPKNYYMAANVVVSPPLAMAQMIEAKYRDIPCWAVYSLDYVTGHTVADSFVSAVKAKLPDIKIQAQVFAPLSATDVRPYINALAAAASDSRDCGLFVYAYGGAGMAFIKQATLQDLFSHYKLFAWQGSGDSIMNGVGPKLPRHVGVSEFFPDAYVGISAANRTAEDGWKKAFGVSLPWQSYAAYNGMLAIFAGINKAGSADVGKVQPMLQGLTFDSVKGPITIKNRYFQQSASTYECGGDPAASAGWSCSAGIVLPTAEVTPSQYQ
jgi:branched-chain amino acid transport system substrate-binding protein